MICLSALYFFIIFRLSSNELSEVDQKDSQVRLQELFRDRKTILESCLSRIGWTYEHILQVWAKISVGYWPVKGDF